MNNRSRSVGRQIRAYARRSPRYGIVKRLRFQEDARGKPQKNRKKRLVHRYTFHKPLPSISAKIKTKTLIGAGSAASAGSAVFGCGFWL
jgi:hypothetical protein